MERAPESADSAVARVRESFARQGLMLHLGAELIAVADGSVTIALRARPEVSQQHGFVHGGATSAIADSAGGYAALTRMPSGSEVLTVDFTLNLLAPASGQSVEAVGSVVRSGRTLTVCRLDAWSIDGGQRRHIATGQQTLIRVDR